MKKKKATPRFWHIYRAIPMSPQQYLTIQMLFGSCVEKVNYIKNYQIK